MKNLGKILAVVAVVGVGVAVAKGASSNGEVVASGEYENKGQVAKWEIRSKDGSNFARVKFPGSDWTEIASNYGDPDALGPVIDQTMRENGYLPAPGVGEEPAQATFQTGEA